jgi:hypothetical protein
MAGAAQPLGGAGHERQNSPAIQVAEFILHRLVAHDDPPPAAQVAPVGGLLGQVDAVEQQLVGDRSFQVEPPAHRPGGRQDLVDVSYVAVHLYGNVVGSSF